MAPADVLALAAKSATSTIPIVFVAGDPVAVGLVAGLARPGGNLTGVSILTIELIPKRLELLSELVPQAKSIALLVNPNNAYAERVIRDVQETARTKGLQLHILKAGAEGEFETAFASLVQAQAAALLVSPDSFFISRRGQLVAAAAGATLTIPIVMGHRRRSRGSRSRRQSGASRRQRFQNIASGSTRTGPPA
jgi:putative ABC transport system substrate-binding protein